MTTAVVTLLQSAGRADNLTMTQTAAAIDPLAEYVTRARAYVAKDCTVYGLPSSGPLFENLVAYLANPDAHDFRLTELPGLTGDPAILAQPRKILDVGCGPGTLVWKALDLGHDAMGIDLNEEKIELARSWTRAKGRPERQARVQIQDAGRLPFDSIRSTSSAATTYSNMSRICRPYCTKQSA